jgi:hypothetical protein
MWESIVILVKMALNRILVVALLSCSMRILVVLAELLCVVCARHKALYVLWRQFVTFWCPNTY